MRRACFLAILLLPLGVPSARAADCVASGRAEGVRFSLGAFAGPHVFAEGTNLGEPAGSSDADGARNDPLGGMRAAVALGRWFVSEAELVGLATEDRVYQSRARLLGYRVCALAPLTAGAFRPFVLVGVGAMQVASSAAQDGLGLALDTKAEMHTGVGFDYRLPGGISVRGDARVLQVPSKQRWRLTTDVEAMLGATVAIGAPVQPSSTTKAAPVVAGDGHGDEPVLASLETATPAATSGESLTAQEQPAPVAVAAVTISDLLERARDIRFEPGTLKLTEPSLSFLSELARALVRDPSAHLEIVVHTAGSSDPKKDLAFSQRRAEAIKQTLVDEGAASKQLLATGRGSEDPVAPNLTRTGRMRNERVELHRSRVP